MNSPSHRFLQNTIYLNASTVVSRLIGLVTAAILARSLGRDAFGQLTIFGTISTMFIIISDFGTVPYVTRAVARDKTDAAGWFKQIVLLDTILMIPLGLAAIFAVTLLHVHLETKLTIIFSVIFLFWKSYYRIADSFFSAFERLKYSAVWEFVYTLLFFGLIALLYETGTIGLTSVMLANIAAAFIMFGGSFWQIGKIITLPDYSIPAPRWEIIRESFPFLLSYSASVIYYQADVFMLRWIHGPAATGYYGVALTVYSGLLFVLANLSRTIFPIFSRLHKESPEQFRNYANRILWFTLVFVTPITAGGVVLSRDILLTVFGKQYLPATLTLSFCLVSFSFQFFGALMTIYLQASHHQNTVVKISWLTVIIALGFGFPLIYFYGNDGAAATRLLTNLFIMAASTVFVLKEVCSLDVTFRMLKPLAAAALMVLCLYIAPGLNIFIKLVIGIAVYSSLILLFRTFSKDEYTLFYSFFLPRRKTPPPVPGS